MPFNPKDWVGVIPTAIIVLILLVVIGVWAAQKLGLVARKNGNGNGDSNGLKARVEILEAENLRLRDWRHVAEPQIQLLMADHLARLKANRR